MAVFPDKFAVTITDIDPHKHAHPIFSIMFPYFFLSVSAKEKRAIKKIANAPRVAPSNEKKPPTNGPHIAHFAGIRIAMDPACLPNGLLGIEEMNDALFALDDFARFRGGPTKPPQIAKWHFFDPERSARLVKEF